MATTITPPKFYSSINTPCIFDVERDISAVADISINGYTKQMQGSLLRVNVSSYYKNDISITPLESTNMNDIFTIYDEVTLDRVVRAVISLDDTTSSAVPLILSDKPIVANRFMTDVKRRFVMRGDVDEISVYSDKYIQLDSHYQQIDIAPGITSISFKVPEVAPERFNISLIDVSGVAIDSIEYVVLSQNGARLCWVNSYGAIDYWNFTNRCKKAVKAVRNKIYTSDGYTLTSKQSETTTTVSTIALPEDLISGLCQILTADSVWLVNDNTYMPIDIISETSIISEIEKLTALQVEYRNKIREI